MKFTRSKKYRHRRRRTQRGGLSVQEVCRDINTAATVKDADKIYKKAALKFHPDKGGNEEDFKALTACIERKRAAARPAAAPAAAPAPQPRPAAPQPRPAADPPPRPAAPAPAPQPRPAPAAAPQPRPAAAPTSDSISGYRSASLALSYTTRKYTVQVKGDLTDVDDEVKVYSDAFNGIFKYKRPDDGNLTFDMDVLEVDGSRFKGQYIEHIEPHKDQLVDVGTLHQAGYADSLIVNDPSGFGSASAKEMIMKVDLMRNLAGKFEPFGSKETYFVSQNPLVYRPEFTGTNKDVYTGFVYVDLYDKKTKTIDRYLVGDKTPTSNYKNEYKIVITSNNLKNAVVYSRSGDEIYLIRMIGSEKIPRLFPEKPFNPGSRGKGTASAGGSKRRSRKNTTVSRHPPS
jgi:hypothetical protein